MWSLQVIIPGTITVFLLGLKLNRKEYITEIKEL